MGRTFKTGCLLAASALCAVVALAADPAPAQPQPENFYNKSLHYTNSGLTYWYGKEQGGLEKLTGLPASALGCAAAKCHVYTCDECHRKDADGKASYSVAQAKSAQACEKCHGPEPEDAKVDVHLLKQMKCTDCHSAREVHGDGVAYTSCSQPGAMDTTCEKCHQKRAASPSHTIHRGKVDCGACHVKGYTTCLNCHIDSRLKGTKEVSIPVKNMIFLVNHEGKVGVANLLSYVYQNKTMITLASFSPHLIVKDARKCGDCHGTQIAKDIAAGKFKPFRYEKGEVKGVEGVIPAVEGMKWELPFFNLEDGKWVPIPNPPAPLFNYAGYCTPLTKDQLARLEKAQGAAKK